MPKQKNLQAFVLVLILSLNVACDQLSKLIVREKLAYSETISVVKNHFILTKVENTGAFLSTGDNLPNSLRLILLTVLPLMVLGYGIYFLFRKNNLPTQMQLGICFLIGGGIGNIYDRIIYGSVTDFMHIDFGIFRTGVFNVADVSIMFGIGILILHNIKTKVKATKQLKNVSSK